MSRREISEYLIKNGIHPTHQRIKVYEYLLINRNHPTIDVIYKDMIGNNPTLSKTTVYNSMKVFMEKGLIAAVYIEPNELRCDIDTSVHGHFKCKKCGAIFDFPLDAKRFVGAGINGVFVEETQIIMSGVCERCK